MNDNISDDLLAKLSERISVQMGLYFPKKNWKNLRRGLRFAASGFGFEDTQALAQWLLSAPLTKDRIDALACHLTIGETYFFREMNAFNALKDSIFPQLLSVRRNKDKRVRIWSAGCSSGEEAYSIAILLSRLIPDLRDWKITVLATDVNPRSLQKALHGFYTEWSFRNPPPWLKSSYFKEKDKGYEIASHIKQIVTFSSLNLAEDPFPSLTNDTNAMDVIFCRNVMMYFSEKLRKRVIENFHHALVDGGWLIVSPSEATSALFPQFTAVNFPGAIFFKKDQGQTTVQPLWPTQQPETADFTFPIPTLSEPPQKNQASLPVFPALGTPTSSLSAEKGGWQPPFPDNALNSPPLLPIEGGKKGVFNHQPEPAEPLLPQPVRYDQALVLYKQGRYKETIEILTAMSSLSTHQEAIDLLIRAYANQGKLADALEWCQKAIILDKLNSSLHYLRATILIEQNQFTGAAEALRRTLFLDPDFVLAYLAMGNIALQQGRVKESKKHLNNVRQLLQKYHPDDVIPESEGMTAERLQNIVETMLAAEG